MLSENLKYSNNFDADYISCCDPLPGTRRGWLMTSETAKDFAREHFPENLDGDYIFFTPASAPENTPQP